MIPTRHRPTVAIRAQYGDRVDRLGPMLMEGDPPADAAVAALAGLSAAEREAMVNDALDHGIASVPNAPADVVAFFTQLDRVPFWVDFERSDRGGAALLRSGPLGGLILGLRSLIGGYCSPAGNKPLMFSGRLREDVPRRLTETSRFVQLTSLAGGMRRHGGGFRSTVKVRLMHAQIRRMLLRSPKWNSAEWGVPINQFDMAGTTLLFSLAVIDGLRQLGYRITAQESEDFMHLWRYAGNVMGVREELLCASEAEAKQLWEMIGGTQAPPDDDSRALASSLIEHSLTLAKTPEQRARAQKFVRFAYGLSRYLIGDDYADSLAFPKTAWRFGLPAISAAISRADSLRRGIPGSDRLALSGGVRYWQEIVLAGVGGVPVTFAMPEQIRA